MDRKSYLHMQGLAVTSVPRMNTEFEAILLRCSPAHTRNHRLSCRSVLRPHGSNSQSHFQAKVPLHILPLKQTQIVTLVNPDTLQESAGGQGVCTEKYNELCEGKQGNGTKLVPSQAGCCPSHSPDAWHCSLLERLKTKPSLQPNSHDEFQAKFPEGWEQLRNPWVGVWSAWHSATRNAIKML